MIKRTLLTACIFCITLGTATAQTNRQLVMPGIPEFLPHWQLSIQGGAGYDIGEAKFGDLLSPAVQVAGTYQFSEIFGARLAVNGAWARNRYVFPDMGYKWNFIQPTLELKVDLASLFFGWVYDQPVSPFITLGGGVAYSFNNKDAEKAYDQQGVPFQKLWRDNRFNPVVRGGVGADFRISDRVAIEAEVNANMLPDHFNSKLGKNDNRDWHFTALVGVKINLSPSYRFSDPIYREIPAPVKKEPMVRDTVAMSVNIQFLINNSQLRSSEFPKLHQLVEYMKTHPRAHVEMTGYADRLTGTPTINQRLSVERAARVADYLVSQGIDRDRIYKQAKGDREQPFPINEDNRVTVCYVVDMLY